MIAQRRLATSFVLTLSLATVAARLIHSPTY